MRDEKQSKVWSAKIKINRRKKNVEVVDVAPLCKGSRERVELSRAAYAFVVVGKEPRLVVPSPGQSR